MNKTAFLNLSRTFRLCQTDLTRCTQLSLSAQKSFPGGERYLRVDVGGVSTNHDRIVLGTSIQSSHDVMDLLLATDAVRHQFRNAKVELMAPYFPYARHDRRMLEGEPHGLRTFAKLINSQGYDSVHVLDPHSDVVEGTVDRLFVHDSRSFVIDVWNSLAEKHGATNINLVSPDAGAEKRTYQIANSMNLETDQVIFGTKKRNPKTGEIERIGTVSGREPAPICLIVDDILDSGGTHCRLAKHLRERGAQKVYLAVTHALFSSNPRKIESAIDGVYTVPTVKPIYGSSPGFTTYMPANIDEWKIYS